MGLDMYLERKTYVGHYKDDAKIRLEIPDGAWDEAKKVKGERVTYVIEQMAYWRKANAIHNWFVQTLANGVDDCQEIPVTAENLRALIALCTQVLEFPETAWQFLPSQSGFFFGSTEYDDYYFDDLRHTVEMLEKVLAEDPESYGKYTYQASW